MSHGAKDWSNLVSITGQFVVPSMAEIGVRCGSPVIFDRRGEVLFICTFDYGINVWTYNQDTATDRAILSANLPCFGPYCFYFTGKTGGLGQSFLDRYFPKTTSKLLGSQFRFNYIADMDYIIFDLLRNEGNDSHIARVKISFTNSIIQIQDQSLGWVTIHEDDTIGYAKNFWQFFKIRANFETGIYTELLYNDLSFDITDYALKEGASWDYDFVSMHFGLYDHATLLGQLKLDSIILTHND